MVNSIPIGPDGQINPVMTVCVLCGEQDGGIALLGESRVTDCGHCGAKNVYYVGRRSKTCARCGHAFGYGDHSRPYKPETDGPLAGGYCDRCKGWLDHGCVVRCSGCRRIYEYDGAYRLLVDMTPEEQKAYMLEDGSDLDFPRLITDNKAERVKGQVIRTDHCHFCDPNLPKPEEKP